MAPYGTRKKIDSTTNKPTVLARIRGALNSSWSNNGNAVTTKNQMHGTTILSVRQGEHVVIGGDGQVTLGETIMKGNARKVRRLYEDKVIAGFAGGTADAFTLFERLSLIHI